MKPFLSLCLLFLLACGKKTNVPKDVLPPPQMTDVLWDMMLADELVANNLPVDTGTVRFDTSIIIYSQIAEAHNTTQAQFKKSLDYYKTRPDLMKVILDTLNNRTMLPPPAEFNKDSLTVQ